MSLYRVTHTKCIVTLEPSTSCDVEKFGGAAESCKLRAVRAGQRGDGQAGGASRS